MRAIKQAGVVAAADWLAERRKHEVVTVGCAWCSWARTGTADVVLELQRAHVQRHPEHKRFDRKAHDRRIEREKAARRRELEKAESAERKARNGKRARRVAVVRPSQAREYVPRVCAHEPCENTVGPQRRADAIYCSHSCAQRAAWARGNGKRSRARAAARVGRTCRGCGAPMPLERDPSCRYCSNECQQKRWHRKSRAAA